MRDKRFVTVHRGGLLKKEQHRQLIRWARGCVKHVFHLLGESIDDRLTNALKIAKDWEKEKVSVGEARSASLGAIAVANEPSDKVKIAVARAAGHAVATAHMADHSLKAAAYALKAIEASGRSVEAEQRWQDEYLPANIRKLVLSARKKNIVS